MDTAAGWDGPDNYSQFLPDDAFKLFGEYDLNLDFTQLLPPEFEEANTAFETIEQVVQKTTTPDVNLPSLSSAQPNELMESSEITLLVYQHDSASTPETLQSPISKDNMTTDTDSPGSTKENGLNAIARKRNFLTAFSATSGEDILLRSRKPFSQQKRQVVALHRTIGVCTQCKLRKVACDSGLPCEQCIKRAGSISSGQEICMRRSLVSTRFDQIDLLSLALKADLVKSFYTPGERGIDAWAYVWYGGSLTEDAPEASIRIPILKFLQPEFRPTRQFVSFNYNCREEYTLPDSPDTIAPGSLPSIGSLLSSYLATRRDYYVDLGPFAGLHKAIRDFVEAYITLPGDIPLKELLSKIIHLQRLFDIYRTVPLMKTSHKNSESNFVSTMMLLQLRLHVGAAIVSVEADVLTKIEKLTQSKEGIGRENPLAMWACLWALILSYKQHMMFVKAMTAFSDKKFYNLNQHIYNMLTSTYAALYKTTSPLTLDWRGKEVADMMGNDAHLINLLCNIKTEMFWFHADRDRLLPEDALFRALVVDNESKLVTAHIKAAKQQGVL